MHKIQSRPSRDDRNLYSQNRSLILDDQQMPSSFSSFPTPVLENPNCSNIEIRGEALKLINLGNRMSKETPSKQSPALYLDSKQISRGITDFLTTNLKRKMTRSRLDSTRLKNFPIESSALSKHSKDEDFKYPIIRPKTSTITRPEPTSANSRQLLSVSYNLSNKQSLSAVLDLSKKENHLTNGKYHYFVKTNEKYPFDRLPSNNGKLFVTNLEPKTSAKINQAKFITPKLRPPSSTSIFVKTKRTVNQTPVNDAEEQLNLARQELFFAENNKSKEDDLHQEQIPQNKEIIEKIYKAYNKNLKNLELRSNDSQLSGLNSSLDRTEEKDLRNSFLSPQDNTHNIEPLVSQPSPNLSDEDEESNLEYNQLNYHFQEKLKLEEQKEIFKFYLTNPANKAHKIVYEENKKKIFDYIKRRENSLFQNYDSTLATSRKPQASETLENLASNSSTTLGSVSKKRVSFHDHVIETDVDSGNSILKPIVNTKRKFYRY